VVLASSDFDEVVSESDRALVMVRGRIAAEIEKHDLTRDRLLAESYAVAEAASGGRDRWDQSE
jgi:ABC-type sugar transport system ATPase subunit